MYTDLLKELIKIMLFKRVVYLHRLQIVIMALIFWIAICLVVYGLTTLIL